jgi:peroxiredoxin
MLREGAMAIKAGDRMPAGTLTQMTKNGPAPISADEIFKGKRVVLFAVPGAFTPTCSAAHLPGFLKHAKKIMAKNVDTIACLAVNDPFVMGAWAQDQKVKNQILMLADGSGDYTRALGLELDLQKAGLGMRSRRYAMLVENGVVKRLNLDEGGALEHSKAEVILNQI